MRHFRKKRITAGKTSVKHGVSLLDNTGSGVGSMGTMYLVRSTAADRNTNGGAINIQTQQSTDELCSVGSVVKYLNICLQISPRGANPTNPNDNNGWLEWSVFRTQEDDTDVTVNNIGTETLGVLTGRIFRQDAVYSG